MIALRLFGFAFWIFVWLVNSILLDSIIGVCLGCYYYICGPSVIWFSVYTYLFAFSVCRWLVLVGWFCCLVFWCFCFAVWFDLFTDCFTFNYLCFVLVVIVLLWLVCLIYFGFWLFYLTYWFVCCLVSWFSFTGVCFNLFVYFRF